MFTSASKWGIKAWSHTSLREVVGREWSLPPDESTKVPDFRSPLTILQRDMIFISWCWDGMPVFFFLVQTNRIQGVYVERIFTCYKLEKRAPVVFVNNTEGWRFQRWFFICYVKVHTKKQSKEEGYPYVHLWLPLLPSSQKRHWQNILFYHTSPFWW